MYVHLPRVKKGLLIATHLVTHCLYPRYGDTKTDKMLSSWKKTINKELDPLFIFGSRNRVPFRVEVHRLVFQEAASWLTDAAVTRVYERYERRSSRNSTSISKRQIVDLGCIYVRVYTVQGLLHAVSINIRVELAKLNSTRWLTNNCRVREIKRGLTLYHSHPKYKYRFIQHSIKTFLIFRNKVGTAHQLDWVGAEAAINRRQA